MKKYYTLLIVIAIGIFFVYSDYQVNELKEQGMDALSSGNYDMGIEKLNKYLSYKPDDKEVKELLNDKTEKLIESSKAYYKAIELISENNYLTAFYKLREVISEDPHYLDAQEKLKDVTRKVADIFVEEAKKQYKNKQYDSAYRQIQEAIVLINKHEEALKLAPIYKKANEEFQKKIAAENEKKRLAEIKAEQERKKSQGVRIGMTQQDVLDSSWGKPKSINRTTTKYGTHEQWVYDNYNYLYFEEGILTTIQN